MQTNKYGKYFTINYELFCCNVKRLRKRFIDLSLYLELKERYMSTRLINPAKGKYKVRNGKEYNSNLCKRDHLTLFLPASVLKEKPPLKKAGTLLPWKHNLLVYE
jgi:hypothetical protein